MSEQKSLRERNAKSVGSYYLRLRAGLIEFMGGKCARCGYDDRRALQIDHIIACGGNRKRWSKLHQDIMGDPRWYERYQLLCANCNAIKVVENGERSGKYEHSFKKGDFKNGGWSY